jgi:hypothetical protein
METNSLRGFWIGKVLFGKLEDLKRIILDWKYTFQDLKGSYVSIFCIHTHHKVSFVARYFLMIATSFTYRETNERANKLNMLP